MFLFIILSTHKISLSLLRLLKENHPLHLVAFCCWYVLGNPGILSYELIIFPDLKSRPWERWIDVVRELIQARDILDKDDKE